jgi:predicted metal-dependent HD superfamily phosphohydrolase
MGRAFLSVGAPRSLSAQTARLATPVFPSGKSSAKPYIRLMTDLQRHWPAALGAHSALRDRLLAAYDEPHRGYHDRRHLAEVLAHVEELAADAPEVDRDTVLLAAWFHDAVYDGSRDDEERSAVLAGDELRAAGVASDVVAEVARLVRLTADHRPAPGDVAGEVLCDADLAILAAGPDRYDEYVADVRSEYAHLDDTTFRAGRAAVLRALLEKPTLFHTDIGRRSWEQVARGNVERELDALT